MSWNGSPLPDLLDLPDDIRSPIRGGSRLWEDAQIGWHLRQSVPEFQEKPQDEIDWLRATWRTMQKISAIEALEAWRKRSK